MAQQFDMFPEQVPRDDLDTRAASRLAKPERPAVPMSEKDMVRHLAETGRYRILTKMVPRAVAPNPRREYPLKGIVLDTETTGLNARKDEIIEIGVIAFSFDATGRIGDVTGIYGGLQQPSISIPSEITRLTGITDDMVVGQSIDTAAAELYEASQRSRIRIFAEHSPFDMKDHLKARGYRWSDGSDGRPKSWWIGLVKKR